MEGQQLASQEMTPCVECVILRGGAIVSAPADWFAAIVLAAVVVTD